MGSHENSCNFVTKKTENILTGLILKAESRNSTKFSKLALKMKYSKSSNHHRLIINYKAA